MGSDAALRIAYDRGLDLVLMSAQSQPPVCRILDYGKFRFEREKKEKEAKKKQTTIELKEVQLSCRIEQHDFDTKVKHALRFLGDGNKVKVVLRFRGREMSHQQIGRDLLKQFADACAEVGSVDKQPVLDGKLMTMIVVPLRNSK